MFTINTRYDAKRIQQFASQVDHLSDEERQLYDENFTGLQSDDFNAGLLAGLAAAHIINQSSASSTDKTNFIAHMLAFVADKIAERGF